jgi:molecular chaperone IbpA
MTLAQALHNDPFAVGFDRIFDRLHTLNTLQSKQGNYPPYNIVKSGDDRYEVEIAVAGFDESEISIELEDGVMTVSGTKKTEGDDAFEYIHKGIAERDFTRKFTLSDTIEVRGADMNNGILSIILENVIPEHKKPRKIAIGQSEAQLLTEDSK